MEHTELMVKCKAFSGESQKMNRVIVSNGQVKVFDDKAGYFTSCHIISQAKQASIKRLWKTN